MVLRTVTYRRDCKFDNDLSMVELAARGSLESVLESVLLEIMLGKYFAP